MPARARRAANALWDALGVGADIQGRLTLPGFLLVTTGGIFAGLRGAVGNVTAFTVAVCAVLAIIFGWATIKAVQREERRQQLALVTGTLIPPGHNAIVTGEPSQIGEWVPPGFKVTNGAGAVSDDLGNSILGGQDNRIYGGTGNVVIGVGNQVGRRPY